MVDDALADSGSIAGGWSLTLGWGTVPEPPPLPAPPQLSSPALLSGHSFQATLQGQAGLTYVIEASVDLTTWTPIATNVPSGATWTFVDPDSSSFGRRFYRGVFRP